jgi:hypothetical protein
MVAKLESSPVRRCSIARRGVHATDLDQTGAAGVGTQTLVV